MALAPSQLTRAWSTKMVSGGGMVIPDADKHMAADSQAVRSAARQQGALIHPAHKSPLPIEIAKRADLHSREKRFTAYMPPP